MMAQGVDTICLKRIKELYKKYITSDNDVMKQEQILPLLRDQSKLCLCNLDQRKVFSQKIFLELLAENIAERNDFSALGTSKAFDALEKYAVNLLVSPWRKEFYSIKLFGGFYKQKVASHLHGAEKILQLMNYSMKDESTLVIERERIVDKNKLMEVALNCQFASCECEILHEVYKVVQSCGKQVTYSDIFRIRKTFPSQMENIIAFFCKDDIRDNLGSSDRRSTADSYLNRDFGQREEVRVGKLIDIAPTIGGIDKFKEREILYPEDKYEPTRKGQRFDSDHLSFNGKPMNVNLQKELRDGTLEHLKPGTQAHHIQASMNVLKENRCANDRPETREESWDYVDSTLKKGDSVGGYRTNFDTYGIGERVRNCPPLSREEMALHEELALLRARQAMLDTTDLNPAMVTRQRIINSELGHFGNQESYPSQHPSMVMGPNPLAMPPPYYPVASSMDHYYWMKVHSQNPMFPMNIYPTAIDPLPVTPSMANLQMRDRNGCPENNLPVKNNGVNSTATNRRSFYDNCSEQANERISDTPPNRNGYGATYPGKTTRSSHVDDDQLSYQNNGSNRQYQPANEALFSDPPPRPPPPYVDDDSLEADDVIAPAQQTRTGTTSNLKSKRNPVSVNSSTNTSKKRSQTYKTAVTSNLKEKTPPPSYQQALIDEPSGTGNESASSGRSSVSRRTSSSDTEKWDCPHCTYVNNAEKDICDMCGRSKQKGAESIPLVTGGRECPQCTLINDQAARSCVACNCSLKDSSTYI